MKKALVLAIVMVLGLGTLAFAGPLSGAWEAQVCFGILDFEEDTFELGFTDFSSELTIDYSVCGWEFESVSSFDMTGWDEQEFTVEGTMGAFTFESELTFVPMSAEFDRWYTMGSVSIAGVDLTGGFVLDTTGAGWAFGIAGLAGQCELAADIYFNSYLDAYGDLQVQTPAYCFCFENVEFTASFPFCCLETVDVSIGFSNEGFDGVTFSLAGVEVPGLAWLTLDIDLTFDDGELGKYLEIEPSLAFGDTVCLDFYFDIVDEDWHSGLGYGYWIDALVLWGIGLECDMGQGVTFSSMTALDWPNHAFWGGYLGYGVMSMEDFLGAWVDDVAAGYETFGFESLYDFYTYLFCSTYWEMFSISSSSDACCGGAFEFGVDVYFGYEWTEAFDPIGSADDEVVLSTDIHPWLFDIALIDANFSIGLGSNFSLTGGITIQDKVLLEVENDDDECINAGLSQFCIGFEVTF